MEKLIARRVAKGNRADESRALLAELIRNYEGTSLALALCYEGFATERAAYRFIEQLTEQQ